MRQTGPPPQNNISSSSGKLRKRRWTREELLRNLELLGNLAAPLPHTLPPSPPASRSSSPVPGFKRKADSSSDPDTVKRPRTNSLSDRQHRQPPPQQSHHSHHQQPQQPHHPHPTQPPSSHLRVPAYTSTHPSRPEPCEDGEVREELIIASSSASASSQGPATNVPIRRPRKGKPSLRHFDNLHDKYHSAGRMLKYSGDARFWSTYSATHREYRPLPDPPPPGSSYHKHGGLIARLELVDALVCFTYSIWNRDYSRRSCNSDTWGTIEAFLGWCKQKWQAEEGISDAEKAFLGLIWMIESSIQGRKVVYSMRQSVEADVDHLVNRVKAKIATAAEIALKTGPSPKSQPTPPMLPSPASIAAPNSANSTPTNRDNDTPNVSSGRPDAAPAQPATARPRFSGPTLVPIPLIPEYLTKSPDPIPEHVMLAMAAITDPVGPVFVQDMKDVTHRLTSAGWCMTNGQATLNLPVLKRCFPTTFARIIHTSLLPTEEHEPDFEDEEGELFWPGQIITGEGLGWLCLMGKAMILEFGKAYDYKGLKGVVPKPEQAEAGSTGPPPQAQYRSNVTPQGHHPPPSLAYKW